MPIILCLVGTVTTRNGGGRDFEYDASVAWHALSLGELDLLIVGAGPAGLAVAIAASKAGLDYVVLEKGALVESIFRFPRQMTFFTTPELLEIGGLPFVTPFEKPTQGEALRYYRRAAETYDLRLELGSAVVRIERDSGGFRLTVRTERGEVERRARHVVVATGYYDHPNRLGIPGEDLPHVSHYWTEPHPYWRRPVVVVGGKNSAAIAALELYRAGAQVTLVHRGQRLSDSIKYWIRPDIENRIKNGEVAARFEARITRIEPEEVHLAGPEGEVRLSAHAVFLLTGYHPDVDLLRGAGVLVDPDTLKPQIDLESLETNVPGLYVAGALASGRETSRIFIENGRFHGEAIVGSITVRTG
jgi:thioredoxin reductase (NADPH)